MEDRDHIIALCRRLGKAHHDKDAAAIVACYTDDAVIYGLAPPLRESLSVEGTTAWLATWEGPILVDAQDVDLSVDGDLAWLSALNHMYGIKTDGAEEDIWFRTTLCFRRIDGAWRIAHDHSSTPFYMDGSLKAAVDLTPSSSQPDPHLRPG